MQDQIDRIINETTQLVDSINCNVSNTHIQKAAADITSLINSPTEELAVLDASSRVNHVLAEHLISLQNAMVDENKPTTTARLLALIDISVELESEHANLAVNILVQIFTIFTTDYLIKDFIPAFLDNKDRGLYLTKHNSLKGKVKPGSRLLVLYNLISYKLAIRNDEESQLILGKFRSFILQAFEINDKLNKAHDWQIKKFEKSKGISTSSKNHPLDISKLYSMFDTSNSMKLVECFSKMDNLLQIESFLKELTHVKKIAYIPLHSKITKFDRWTLNDVESLELQLRDVDFYGTIIIQLKIMLEFAIKVNSGDLIPQHTNLKIKKPDFLTNTSLPIFPLNCVRKINQLQNLVQNALKSVPMPNSQVVDDLININEATFIKMKLNGFTSYPPLSALKEFCKHGSTKPATTTTTTSSSMQKRAFPHKLGTPNLSRVWRTDTRLASYVCKRYTDIGVSANDETRALWKHKRALREQRWLSMTRQ